MSMPIASTTVEQRATERYDLEVQVQVDRVGSFDSWATEDVSAGGMRLKADTGTPPRVGERFEVEFRLPLLPDPVRARGEVRWVNEGVCGVQFTTGLRAREVWAINRLHKRR